VPIFEYRCADCRRRFSVLVGVVAGEAETKCPRCGSTTVSKLISRFAVARSEDDLLDSIADPDKLGDIEDPREMAKWMKQVGREMGEDLGDDFDELVEDAVREEAEGGDGVEDGGDGDAGDE
jgi:putative FmdB family regulatory protein